MRQRVWVAGVLGLALAAVASRAAVLVTGAGATFPYPIYSKWFDEFHKHFSDFQINYQSIGSGGGIRQVTEGTVDFGATDGPMTDEQLAAAKIPILHLPTVLGAVVPTFNLAGIERLRFTPEALAGIFLGKVTKWDDAAIAEANPGVKLPAIALVPMHRSDGSGTTYIFSDYLTAVNPSWSGTLGKGKEIKWPVGLGGKGNEGVAGQVKQTPGSIGYVELAYAKQNKLPYANVRNAAGRYVTPSIASVTAAAAGMKLPRNTDYRVSIVNAPGKDSYPISSMTWILAYQNQPDRVKGAKLVNFLRWAYKDGEKSAAALDYAPLPPAIVVQLQNKLKTIRVAGTQVGDAR